PRRQRRTGLDRPGHTAAWADPHHLRLRHLTDVGDSPRESGPQLQGSRRPIDGLRRRGDRSRVTPGGRVRAGSPGRALAADLPTPWVAAFPRKHVGFRDGPSSADSAASELPWRAEPVARPCPYLRTIKRPLRLSHI